MHDSNSKTLVSECSTIREAVSKLEQSGFVTVVNDRNEFLVTIKDGDIRRALLKGFDMESPLKAILESGILQSAKPSLKIQNAPCDNSEGNLTISSQPKCYNKPVINPEDVTAIIMAGGFGKRLWPLTKYQPKPMLKIHNRPVLEHIIIQLRNCGILKIVLSTHYKTKIIEDYFGDGQQLGVEISYFREQKPLGTAGSLSKIMNISETMLVINGDLLTMVNFSSMLEFHKINGADLTIAVRKQNFTLPYGVVDSEDIHVRSIAEKPDISHFINTGMYVVREQIRSLIPGDSSYDFPEFVNKLLQIGKNIICFPVHEYWLDVGTFENYHRALMTFGKNNHN
jgi:dTDP-glucose pyrophosphorylase